MTSMMMLPPPEKFFSLGLAREGMMEGHDHGDHGEGHQHGGGSEKDGEEGEGQGHAQEHGDAEDRRSAEGNGDSREEHQHAGENGEGKAGDEGEDESEGEEEGGMDMEPMFIVNQKMPAAILATVVGLLLSALVLFRPAWAIRQAMPNQNSAEQIGDLLMGKYMIAFEGAGLMILLGIFGAVFLSRPWKHPDPTAREEIQAAVAEEPAPVETDALEPLFETDLPGRRGVASGEQRRSGASTDEPMEADEPETHQAETDRS